MYKFATGRVPEVLKEALANAGVVADEVDWLLLHQANIRIMETVAKKMGIPMEKVISHATTLIKMPFTIPSTMQPTTPPSSCPTHDASSGHPRPSSEGHLLILTQPRTRT